MIFFLFQRIIISFFFVPRPFSSFCLLRKYTLSVLFTTVTTVTTVKGIMKIDAIVMGVM